MSDVKKESMVMPVISLTPMAEPVGQTAALLAPRAQEPAAPKVTVSFREARFINCVDNVTYFDLVFDICSYDSAGIIDAPEGSGPTMGTVTRRIGVNNDTFARELNNVVQVTYVEGLEKQKLSERAKRLRELSGIPHKDNFV